MLVRMMQQMSGRRFDGREWPSYGGTIEVSDAEGAELCHTAAGSSTPIAVPVVETRAVETADAPPDPKVEVRAPVAQVAASPQAQVTATLPPRAPDPPVLPKRGPGRPPKNGT